MDVGQGHRSTARARAPERRRIAAPDHGAAVRPRPAVGWGRAGDARAPHVAERVARLRGPEQVADRPELAAEPPRTRPRDVAARGRPVEPVCGQRPLALEQRATVSERQQAAGGGERHGTLPGSRTIGEACVEVWRRGVTLMAGEPNGRDAGPTRRRFHVGRIDHRFAGSPQNLRPIRWVTAESAADSVRRRRAGYAAGSRDSGAAGGGRGGRLRRRRLRGGCPRSESPPGEAVGGGTGSKPSSGSPSTRANHTRARRARARSRRRYHRPRRRYSAR